MYKVKLWYIIYQRRELHMFSGIHLKNYKSYRKLDVDFTDRNDENSVIAIYGENGSGKTNLIEPIMKLSESTKTMLNYRSIIDQQKKINDQEDSSDNDLFNPKIRRMLSAQNIQSIFGDSQSIDSDSNTEIKYDFDIKNNKGYYQLIFDENGNLVKEEFYGLLKKRSSKIFSVEQNNGKISIFFSPQFIKSSEFQNDLKNQIMKLWGQHTFLAILTDVSNNLVNPKFIKDNVLANFWIVLNDFQKISFKNNQKMGSLLDDSFLHNWVKGHISVNEEKQLHNTEDVLNNFYPLLYADIERVKYDIKPKDDRLDYSLIIEKKVSGKKIDIPFFKESLGTKNLLTLLPLLLSVVNGNTVVIDEIDSGIHDLLISRVIENLSETDLSGQLIFTTHDTLLMKSLPPESVYVIQVDFEGEKRVVNIKQTGAARVRELNNIQKIYLNGGFSGIPFLNDVDFDEINSLAHEDES